VNGRKALRARLVFGLWLVVAVLYCSLAVRFVGVSMDDRAFSDYLQFAVQIVTDQNRTNRELKQLVLGKAREMEIPLDPARLNVEGDGSDRTLNVSYNVLIQVPFVPSAVFNREFVHQVSYKIPR
jgi:hypothetical protein